jgi:hypothetical protein
MPGTFVVLEDEALPLIGPFLAGEDVSEFVAEHVTPHGWGCQVRTAMSPEEWASDQEVS